MVLWSKQNYRKYKIKDPNVFIGHSDDFASIYEVIYRRFKKWSRYKNEGGDFNSLHDKKNTKIGNDLFKAQNKIHEKTKAEYRNKYGKEAYDKRRGELSATTIINRVMPVISGWLAKEKPQVKTEFVRSIFTYVTSRAPKSGKFVIAK